MTCSGIIYMLGFVFTPIIEEPIHINGLLFLLGLKDGGGLRHSQV